MKLIDILVEENIENGWSWPEHANCITQGSDREIMPATCQPCFAKFEASFNRWFLNGSRIGGFIADILASDYETAIITREQYEAALAAKNDGWIEWGGGKHPPVSTNTVVDVKLEKGYVQSGYPAGEYSWEHIWQGSNIIAYRLHKPNEAERVRASAWSAYAGITEADGESDLNECIGQTPAPVWSGEGLPPVGCECQYRKHKKSEQSEWFTGVVKYTSEFTVVIQPVCYPGETVGHPANFEFRPIRSEAERKRDEAIEEMIKIATMYTTKSLGLDLAFNSIYNSIAAGEIPGVKLED